MEMATLHVSGGYHLVTSTLAVSSAVVPPKHQTSSVLFADSTFLIPGCSIAYNRHPSTQLLPTQCTMSLNFTQLTTQFATSPVPKRHQSPTSSVHSSNRSQHYTYHFNILTAPFMHAGKQAAHSGARRPLASFPVTLLGRQSHQHLLHRLLDHRAAFPDPLQRRLRHRRL